MKKTNTELVPPPDDKKKEIEEEIAEIVREYDLQFSPETCRELFRSVLDVIDGWNCNTFYSDSS